MNDDDLIRQAIHLGIFSTPLTKDVRSFIEGWLSRAAPKEPQTGEPPKKSDYERMQTAMRQLKKKYAKRSDAS